MSPTLRVASGRAGDSTRSKEERPWDRPALLRTRELLLSRGTPKPGAHARPGGDLAGTFGKRETVSINLPGEGHGGWIPEGHVCPLREK